MIDERRIIYRIQTRIDSFVAANPQEKACEQVQVMEEFIQMLEDEAKKGALESSEKNPRNLLDWYREAVRRNCDFIYRLLVKEERAIQSGKEKPLCAGRYRKDRLSIYYIKDKQCRYPIGHCISDKNFINCCRLRSGDWKYQCSITGMVCDTFFVISPADGKEISYLTGKTVPDVLRSWTRKDREEDFDIVFGFSSAGWKQIMQKHKKP